MAEIAMFPVSTVYAETRRAFKQWWIREGSPTEFCGLYNHSRHLYINWTIPPGAFIKSPEGWRGFHPRITTVIRNGLTIVIRASPSWTNQHGLVTVLSSPDHIDFDIPVGYVAYAIRVRGFVKVRIGYLPMSSCLLMDEVVQ